MSIGALLALIDIGFLLGIVWCALDGSRMVRIRKEPWRAVGYYVIGVGAFGLLTHPPVGTVGQMFFRVVEDGGVALVSLLHLLRRIREDHREKARACGVEFRHKLEEHVHHG